MKTATLLIKGRNNALMQTQKSTSLIFRDIFFFNKGKFGVEGSKQADAGGEILPTV